uniref:Ig-like domain-containing protein n=1 Tax=Parastrongyloides trichosuri TaxID=131310 RepID=A0A0N4ZH82_PARTI
MQKRTRCSFLKCEIGFYISSREIGANEHNVLTKYNTIYLFVFDRKDENPLELIFQLTDFKYGPVYRPLVPCPYKNWISNDNYQRFIPDSNIQLHGLSFKESHKDLHVLYPAIVSSGENELLICGEIDQRRYKNVKIGIKLSNYDENLTILANDYELTATENRCSNINLNKEEVFLFTPFNVSGDGKPESIQYAKFINTQPFYSEQYIFVYSKSSIHSITSNNDYKSYWGGLNDLFFQRSESYFKPTCVAKIKDIPVDLVFKINDKQLEGRKIVDDNTEKSIFIVKINNIGNNKASFGCHAKPKGIYDERFNNFYVNKFNLALYKGHVNVTKIKTKEVSFSNSFENMYGKYTCKDEKGRTTYYVQEAKFIILPKTPHNENVEQIVFDEKLNEISCPNIYEGYGVLSEVEFQYKNGQKYSSTKDEQHFKTTDKEVIVGNIDKKILNLSTYICKYSENMKPFLYIKKTILLNGGKKSKDDVLKYLIPIIAVISIGTIGIIIAVVIISIKTVQKKKKSNLLSKASSAISASSMSQSSYSKSRLSGFRNSITSSTSSKKLKKLPSISYKPTISKPLSLKKQGNSTIKTKLSTSSKIGKK